MTTNCMKAAILVACVCAAAGCGRMVAGVSSTLMPSFTEAFFEECDTELARRAVPAHLTMLEGLLKARPDDTRLLISLCKGFAGYAMLHDERRDQMAPSRYYFRARRYGFRALFGDRATEARLISEQKAVIDEMNRLPEKKIEALFWTTVAWASWIGLNLDTPEALAEVPTLTAFVDKLFEVRPEYMFGTPYVLKASILAARPTFLGGDQEHARHYFETAMNLHAGGFLLVPYYYARDYAVRVQDKALFGRLMDHIEHTPVHGLEGACLINGIVKEKAARLKALRDELFF